MPLAPPPTMRGLLRLGLCVAVGNGGCEQPSTTYGLDAAPPVAPMVIVTVPAPTTPTTPMTPPETPGPAPLAAA